jgi:L-fuconolactonase
MRRSRGSVPKPGATPGSAARSRTCRSRTRPKPSRRSTGMPWTPSSSAYGATSEDEGPGFTEDTGFRGGVGLLGEAGLPFDACVRRHQLPELTRLATACPRTTIVLDHLGKPQAADRDEWSQNLRQLAKQQNVVCKLSGLATEVGADAPRALPLALLREALEIFGPERCLYASDRPVMTLATGYRAWLDLVHEALTPYPATAAAAVFRGNARRVSQLQVREAR